MFQSTPPRGGRLTNIFGKTESWKFQSTPPRGGRRPASSTSAWGVCFNPRPRAGGDICSRPDPFHKSSFNPRPRAGGDGSRERVDRNKYRFQSTPPRGGRHSSISVVRDCHSFNPRPRAGGDYLLMFHSCHAQVSIHAPARGATSFFGRRLTNDSLFQSTPPRGGRPGSTVLDGEDHGFQSTPPRGGRREYYFKFVIEPIVSIHAPARGATWLFVVYYQLLNCFNPRPRAGGDLPLSLLFPLTWCFNPRPRAGGDQMVF